MTYQVRVADNLAIDGLDIYVIMKPGGMALRRILWYGSDGSSGWEDIPAGCWPARPTLSLPDEAARALLDVLARNYDGIADLRTARSDLLHERGRVDKLLSCVTELAVRPPAARLTAAPGKPSWRVRHRRPGGIVPHEGPVSPEFAARLRDALHTAAGVVEPAPGGLDRIRARITRPRERG